MVIAIGSWLGRAGITGMAQAGLAISMNSCTSPSCSATCEATAGAPKHSVAWCPQAKKLTLHSLARWACGSEISPVMKACAPAAMGRFEVALRAAAAPSDRANGLLRTHHTDHWPPQPQLKMACRLPSGEVRLPVSPAPHKTQLLFAETGIGPQAQHPAKLCIVAPFGVCIQRKMVGKEVDIVRQQQCQALLHPAGHAAILATPEQTMVHEDRIRLGSYRRFDQRPARRHPGDDLADALPPLDLQAVRSVILETLGLQHGIERLEHRATLDNFKGRCRGKSWSHPVIVP
jgi:hypothetical protein